LVLRGGAAADLRGLAGAVPLVGGSKYLKKNGRRGIPPGKLLIGQAW